MKDKIIGSASLIIVVTAIFLVIYISVTIFYPFKTVDYSVLPFPVLNEDKIVVAGDELFFEVNYCRYTDLPTEVSVALTDGFVYTLSGIPSIRNPIGCGKNIQSVDIPMSATPGTYHLRMTVSWEINHLRVITREVTTEDFTIVKR